MYELNALKALFVSPCQFVSVISQLVLLYKVMKHTQAFLFDDLFFKTTPEQVILKLGMHFPVSNPSLYTAVAEPSEG